MHKLALGQPFSYRKELFRIGLGWKLHEPWEKVSPKTPQNIINADFQIASMELLYALGCIDDAGSLTRPLGEQMSEFPVPATLSKILLSSQQFGWAC